MDLEDLSTVHRLSLNCRSVRSLERVGELSGKPEAVTFHEVDLCDLEATKAAVSATAPTAVIHFAGLKAVGESVAKPLKYYENNIAGTFNLLRAMEDSGCNRLIFSSSATVYGTADPPFTEESTVGVGVTNPYGWTKFMLEQILGDVAKAKAKTAASAGGEGGEPSGGPAFKVVLLRYFNPVGAHSSGRIGEDPTGPPNNLMPFIQQVAVGRREKLTIFGDDWPTEDGTAERDYIHVVDLAKGHVSALAWMAGDGGGPRGDEGRGDPVSVFNLGTGTRSSVKQVLASMEKAVGRTIPSTIGPRRDGDLAVVYAKAGLATEVLGWTADKGLDEMCADAWRWQEKNPFGFRTKEEAKEAGVA